MYHVFVLFDRRKVFEYFFAISHAERMKLIIILQSKWYFQHAVRS